jgi:hypothetical protein
MSSIVTYIHVTIVSQALRSGVVYYKTGYKFRVLVMWNSLIQYFNKACEFVHLPWNSPVTTEMSLKQTLREHSLLTSFDSVLLVAYVILLLVRIAT